MCDSDDCKQILHFCDPETGKFLDTDNEKLTKIRDWWNDACCGVAPPQTTLCGRRPQKGSVWAATKGNAKRFQSCEQDSTAPECSNLIKKRVIKWLCPVQTLP